MPPVTCAVLFCFEGARLSDDMTHNCSHTAKAEGRKIWGNVEQRGRNGGRMKLPNMTLMNVFFTMHKHYSNFKLPHQNLSKW